MKLYTINATPITEDMTQAEATIAMDNYPLQVMSILRAYLIDGFTMYEVQGFWNGKAERSFKIEIAVEPVSVINSQVNVIKDIALELKHTYNQESVMLTVDNEVEFL